MKKAISLSIMFCMAVSTVCYAQNANEMNSDIYSNDKQQITLPNVQSSPITAIVQSLRIPAGTKIKIRMSNSVNSENSGIGSYFIGTLAEDVRVNNRIALPYGTEVRGNVSGVKKSTFLSRGGQMSLAFDHVVTPLGTQVPFQAKLTKAGYLTPNGNLNAGGGYLCALSKNMDRGVDLTVKITSWGTKEGLSVANGYPVILTAPLSAFVGVGVGGGIFFVDSVKSIFKKGDNVKLQASEIIEAVTVQPMDLPVN